jgi:hypothetical protein
MLTGVYSSEIPLSDANGVADFCTLSANYMLNRVELKLNHPNTGIDFAHANNTLNILGFTESVLNVPHSFTAVSMPAFKVAFLDWEEIAQTASVTLPDGTYTVTQLKAELNALISTATGGDHTACINDIQVAGSQQIEAVDASGKPTVLAHTVVGRMQYTSEAGCSLLGPAGKPELVASFIGMDNDDPAYVAYVGPFVHKPYADLPELPLGPAAQLVTEEFESFPGGSAWALTNTSRTFVAQNRATIDKVTEIGIGVTPLVKGSVDSSGRIGAGVLARFQIEGDPGSVMVAKFENPIKINISQFIGQDVDKLTINLVDQDGVEIPSIMGEHWSLVLVVEVET